MKPKNSLVLIVSLVVVVIIGAVVYHYSKTSSDTSMDGMVMTTASPSVSGVATNAVTVQNFAFSPAAISVKVGTTVTWTNQDDVSHTITVDSGTGPMSQLIGRGQSYSYTFSTTGTFTYHCTPHPYMKGTVIVSN